MREILFRGRNAYSKEWAYGYYQFDKDCGKHGHSIIEFDVCGAIDNEVIPETVGQYTGLKDADGVRIFEGDVIEKIGVSLNEVYCCAINEHLVGQKYVVVFLKSGFTLVKLEYYKNNPHCETPNVVGKINNYNFWNGAGSGCKVIGNIHESK